MFTLCIYNLYKYVLVKSTNQFLQCIVLSKYIPVVLNITTSHKFDNSICQQMFLHFLVPRKFFRVCQTTFHFGKVSKWVSGDKTKFPPTFTF